VRRVSRAPERIDVPVEGGTLAAYRWSGDGPVVLAAHGITSNHRSWGLVAAALDGAATLVAPDLRGRGRSNGLPGRRLVDSAELVNWVRLVKSPHELDHLRIAGAIAEQAMRVALDRLRPGRRQCDVAAEILAAQATGTPEHGGHYPAIVPMLPTGDAAGTPHLTWSDRPFVDNQATTVELAGVHGRYHAPLARTVMLGDPPRRLRETAKIVADGMQATLSTIRPGVTGSAVHAAFNAVIAAHGLVKESRIGYSIGIGYPPDWGERTVSLRSGETTVLTAGMAFHVILGMWMDGWGYELSEPVVVSADGVERLTGLSHELTIRR